MQPVGAYEGTHQSIQPAPVAPPDPAAEQASRTGMSSQVAGSTAQIETGRGAEGGAPDASAIDSTVVIATPEPAPDAGSVLAPPPSSEACNPTSTLAALQPRLDMYIVMDANITLPFFGAWEFASAGLQQFVTDPRSQDLGVGLRLFGLECEASAYDEKPTVEVDVVSNTASDIISKTSQRISLNASPMLPALQGGITHQSKRATRYTQTKQIVVLLTDGISQDLTCIYSEQDVENAAGQGFAAAAGEPVIETYVIGFGLPSTPSQVASDILDRFLPLKAIATAGGGTSQTLDSGDDPSLMNEALQLVRRQAKPCEYLVPKMVEPTKLILAWSPGGEVPKVDNANSCGNREGWYFDAPSAPGRMRLCPKSCDSVQGTKPPTAQLFVGCPPRRRAD